MGTSVVQLYFAVPEYYYLLFLRIIKKKHIKKKWGASSIKISTSLFAQIAYLYDQRW
uniref:Uncharacterized protein n=1 Tax=Solanum tuberosum TaxID=4113 RepID=M1D485_SOLTU